MKLKKLLATTLALALALSPVNVFAAETTTPGSTPDLSISGNVDYLDTVVYKVALPTTQNMSFLLDPQGLAGANTNGVSLNNLADYAGKIVGIGVASATNKSSVPILLSCKMYVTDKDNKVPVGIDFVNRAVNASANEANLTICPLASGNAIPVSVNSGQWVPAAAKTVSGTSAAKADEIRFVLGAADYVVKLSTNGVDKEFVPQAPGTGVTVSDNTAFCISGNVAKDADWSQLAEGDPDPLKLNAVFSFEGLKTFPRDVYEAGTKVLTDNATVDKIVEYDKTVAVKSTAAVKVGPFPKEVKGVTFSKNGAAPIALPLSTGYALDSSKKIIVLSATHATNQFNTACSIKYTVDFGAGDTTSFTITVK